MKVRRGSWDDGQPLDDQWMRGMFRSTEEGRWEKLQDELNILTDFIIELAMRSIDGNADAAKVIVECISNVTHDEWEVVHAQNTKADCKKGND